MFQGQSRLHIRTHNQTTETTTSFKAWIILESLRTCIRKYNCAMILCDHVPGPEQTTHALITKPHIQSLNVVLCNYVACRTSKIFVFRSRPGFLWVSNIGFSCGLAITHCWWKIYRSINAYVLFREEWDELRHARRGWCREWWLNSSHFLRNKTYACIDLIHTRLFLIANR